jgi:hypothetical protein
MACISYHALHLISTHLLKFFSCLSSYVAIQLHFLVKVEVYLVESHFRGLYWISHRRCRCKDALLITKCDDEYEVNIDDIKSV